MTIFHDARVVWPITTLDVWNTNRSSHPPGNSNGILGERQTMNRKVLFGLAICVACPLLAGCATAPGVVRAQSPPAACGPNGCDNSYSCDNGGCLPRHEYFYHYIGPEKGSCLEGSCLAGCCLLKNGCCVCGCAGLPDCLTNRGPLVYPQNPSPAALIQYPYYMCKGPDDFFYPPIGPRP